MSRRSRARALVALSALLLGGCAGVVVAEGDGPRGAVRVHPPKAFLAVSRLAATGPDGATHETRLLLLPDPDRARWVRVAPGLGGASVEVVLERGMLAALEATTDGRAPETGAAAGKAAASLLDAVAARASARARAVPLAGEAPVERLLEIRPRPDGDVDLVPVPPARVRRLLGTARSEGPVERTAPPR